MPAKGQKMTYSHKSGDSHYPILPGSVIRISSSRKIFNSKIVSRKKDIAKEIPHLKENREAFREFKGQQYDDLTKKIEQLKKESDLLPVISTGAGRGRPWVDMAHDVYIWVHSLSSGELRKGQSEKDRRVHLVFLYVPQVPQKELKIRYSFARMKKPTKYSVTKYLRDHGYELVGNVTYNYTKEVWRKFYKLIGLVIDEPTDSMP